MIEMIRKNFIKLAKMKKKVFFIFIAFVFISLFLLWLINSPQKHLSNIVSKTKLHIKNINSKLQSLEPSDELEDTSKDLEVDSTYLELLGFVKEPNLFNEEKQSLVDTNNEKDLDINKFPDNINSNNNIKFNGRIPPLVTAFSRFSEKEKALIESKIRYFLNDLIIIYDLDLSSSEQLKVILILLFIYLLLMFII
jgi:hypothetical protein